MKETVKDNRGGKRANAGRKTTAPRTIRHGYRLNAKEDQKLTKALKASKVCRSEFVRAAIMEKVATTAVK
ncbi:MAG TPA: hypothetical protein VHO03_16695 [Ignavibacteriales bacterium]|nr:hypothetical protein [Ignavibacteriales bacterium]